MQRNSAIMRDYFQQMADSIGGIYSNANGAIDTLLSGNFNFHHYHGGLSTHISQAKELLDASNFVEIPAAISFNIIFEGTVRFSLANETHQLGATQDDAIECSAIIAPQSEVLTRHTKKDMFVRKLNLFVERTWLEARCKNVSDHTLVDTIFQRNTTFMTWKASKKVIKLATQLMRLKKSTTVIDEIENELLTIQLLLQCLHDLGSFIDTHQLSDIPNTQHLTNPQQHLKQKIDSLLHHNYSLLEMAHTLNTSISTLQRNFKKSYGMTVSVYVKQRKLEKARKLLMMKGISIGEAAYLAGYTYPSNFITAFKKRFSITPASLIRKHHKMHDVENIHN